MIELIINSEFESEEKSLIVVAGMMIKIDRLNRVLLSYDIVNNKYIDPNSEGKLVEINSDIASRVESRFNIEIKDYGVSLVDETITMEIQI